MQQLDAIHAWVVSRGRFDEDKQRERLAGVFIAAREELAGRAVD
jgi:hypothetical protein